MDRGFRRFFCLFALQALLFIQCAPSVDAAIGVVYGTDADNLPLPSQVVQLLVSNGVTRVRINDASDTDVLKAFVGSGIQLIVGIPNEKLAAVGLSNATAAAWVQTYVVPYATSVNITAIAVGSEVLTTFQSFSSSLVRTMLWIQNTLVATGLDSRIKVSTPLSTDVLQNSFPPSQSVFNASYVSTIQTLLQFYSLTGSYFMLNVHTFDVYQASSQAVKLDYALFQPETPVLDTYSNLEYFSLFDALVDSCYAAMKVLNASTVRVLVTESGWPSAGDSNQEGANVTNAQTYNNNLVKKAYNNSGTPATPQFPITAYVYELFNEDLQTGPTSSRNYGLFKYNLEPVYTMELTQPGRVLTGNGTEYQTWCVALTTATPQALQAALDWACGELNCSTISSGGSCFNPNTLQSHASWAFNAWYQQTGNAPNSCDFGGVAHIISYDPSSGTCVFQASNVTTSLGGQTPPTSPNGAQTLQFQIAMTLGYCFFVLYAINFRFFRG